MSEDELDPTADDARNGASIADRADDEEEQGELFERGVLDGDRKSIASIIKPTASTEVVVVMTGAETPLRDGLLDPNKLVRLAVTCEVGEYKQRPVRERQADGTKKIVAWKMVCSVKPVFSESLGMGVDAMERSFEQALAIDATEAGAMLDRLQERFAEYMRSGEVAA